MKARLVTLAILALLAFFNQSLFLLLLFTTMFLPGYVIVERYFQDLKNGKLALYILLSILVSTHFIYYLSLFMGYNLSTLKVSSLLLLSLILLARKPRVGKNELLELAIFITLFLFSFTILYHSLWYQKGDYIVLSGSNWQDTPYHYEIIESLNNGNFPPQEPSFAGYPMHYHYFVDFHTAILEKPLGYAPRLMLYLDSALFPLFFLSVLALAEKLTESRRAAVYSAILAVFGWGFTYLWLFSSIISGNYDPKSSYVMDYGGLLNLPPILDNLLQQRPLLIGLPGLVFALLFFIKGYEERKKSCIILSGIITGLLLPFHILATFCIFVFIALYSLYILTEHGFESFDSSKRRAVEFIKLSFPFAISILLFTPFLGMLGGGGIQKPWIVEYGGPLHYLANLGIPLVLAAIAILLKVGRWKLTGLWALIMLSFPLFPSLTPNPWDMYKFFIIAWVPISILASQVLVSLKGRLRFLVPILLVLSTLSTIPVILWNQTDYGCASADELQAGLWVREHTPSDAVFLTWPSLHSPPTMIGGRLRVLGYTNWAYGHGVPFDKIWERVEEIKFAFRSEKNLSMVIDKYNVDYVYLGLDEYLASKNSSKVLMNSPRLLPVFEKGGIMIYKVVRK